MIEVKSGAKSNMNDHYASSTGMARVNEADGSMAMNSNYFNESSQNILQNYKRQKREEQSVMSPTLPINRKRHEFPDVMAYSQNTNQIAIGSNRSKLSDNVLASSAELISSKIESNYYKPGRINTEPQMKEQSSYQVTQRTKVATNFMSSMTRRDKMVPGQMSMPIPLNQNRTT